MLIGCMIQLDGPIYACLQAVFFPSIHIDAFGSTCGGVEVSRSTDIFIYAFGSSSGGVYAYGFMGDMQMPLVHEVDQICNRNYWTRGI